MALVLASARALAPASASALAAWEKRPPECYVNALMLDGAILKLQRSSLGDLTKHFGTVGSKHNASSSTDRSCAAALSPLFMAQRRHRGVPRQRVEDLDLGSGTGGAL